MEKKILNRTEENKAGSKMENIAEKVEEKALNNTAENGVEKTVEHCCHCGRKKERSDKEYKDLIKRLNRMEGQIRGLKGMVEKDAYCIDILTQVSAVTAALNSFSQALLENHLKTCVMNDILSGDEESNVETMDELMVVIKRLMK